MRTTLDLDDDLLARAMRETGARTKTEVIEKGLEALIAIETRKRVKALFGKVPSIRSVPRRRSV
jgi:Arc/MetJ family transcription regulator